MSPDTGLGKLPLSLLPLGRRRSIRSGTLVFQQDEPAASCLYIESGEISLRRFSGTGDEVEIARVSAGEWCAEAIVFAEGDYPAQAFAVSDSVALEFRRRDILGATDPAISAFFLRLLAMKCLKLNKRIEQLTIMGTKERLAQYILGLCPGHVSGCEGGRAACSFPFPKKKREIAEELGMAPETLSRTLRQLETDGLVKIDGPKITIPSCARLRGLIEEER
jgi:CRP/FNR family transcriptional regulator